MSVKVYISNEIRRFPLAPYSTYSSLVRKIESFGEIVRNKCTKIYQKSDLILIECDEDLSEAVAKRKDDVLRLFVSIAPLAQVCQDGSSLAAGIPSENEPVHIGVQCDACDGVLRGSRFECIVCVDYDLCAECEAQRRHDHHPMLRIRSPNDSRWRAYCNQAEVFSQVNAVLNQLDFVSSNKDLTKVGDALSIAMKNFGIDVDYEIRPHGGTKDT